MYRPDEDSVTTVSASAVRGHCAIGEQCTIIMNKKEYTGKVAAKGTNVIYIYFTF